MIPAFICVLTYSVCACSILRITFDLLIQTTILCGIVSHFDDVFVKIQSRSQTDFLFGKRMHTFGKYVYVLHACMSFVVYPLAMPFLVREFILERVV